MGLVLKLLFNKACCIIAYSLFSFQFFSALYEYVDVDSKVNKNLLVNTNLFKKLITETIK